MHGHSIIAGKPAPDSANTFQAHSPQTGKALYPHIHEASEAEVDSAVRHAEEAFEIYRRRDAEARAVFLETIAEEILALGDTLLQRIHEETALPLDRLKGERARTVGQLKGFAELVREGSWVDARVDTGIPDRTPLPKPDLRRMLVPLGPVGVLGASNFPLAFSVAGGDTASALAAGCTVVVKGHPAHPGTSELTAVAIYKALEKCGLPAGVFSLIQGREVETAQALVRHPLLKALGFTGSVKAGRALADAAAARPEPIPVYAEMGSVNPVFLLPGALRERGTQIAAGLKNSFTASVGQMCTKPGIVFALGGPDFDQFAAEFRGQVRTAACGTMLHKGIADSYYAGIERVREIKGVSVIGESDAEADPEQSQAEPVAFLTDAETFLLERDLREEVFGPYTLLVLAHSTTELEAAARSLQGQLTATVHGNAEDLAAFGDLTSILERRAGRIIVNGFPTGVEVCPSMQHGGPYPATTDSRTTSVGTASIHRWARPVAYQNFPHDALPVELRDDNPRKLLRTVNGVLGR